MQVGCCAVVHNHFQEGMAPRNPNPSLPKPGEILTYDFRTDATKNEARTRDPNEPVKLVSWNIERGYKLPAIIEELKSLDADVLSIQEIDIHCERSDWEDTGVKIAEALGLKYIFICEFEELHSSLREPSAQGGGVHGNGIMSKFDISDTQIVRHKHHPINWENPDHPLCKKEPRHGERLTMASTIQSNQGPLLLYNAHLEVFCGMLARMEQFADIFAHVRSLGPTAPQHQAILGDINTQANSLARLSSNYCTDRMRWRSLGWFEAEVWDKFIFGCQEDPADPQKTNAWLRAQGVNETTCRDMVNPGFSDPWDPRRDVTIDLHKYRWFGLRLMTGKLDWVLTRRMKVLSKKMGNDEYDKSDHKWLMVEVMFEPASQS